jgi:glycerol-3-phosphate cytidylyltransferase-like family protein
LPPIYHSLPSSLFPLPSFLRYVDEVVEAAPLTITHDWLLENDIDIVIVATEGGVPAVDQYNQAAEDQYDGMI